MPHELLRVLWQVNRQCNMQCGFCYTQSSPIAHKGLPVFEALKIAEQINHSSIQYLSFIGGEPLLYEGLNQLMATLRPDIKVYLETNGSLIPQKWNDYYAERLEHVSIGFEGPAFINELERKHTSKVARAIKFLHAENVKVKTSIIATKQNCKHIIQAIEFIDELDVSYIQVNGYSQVEGTDNSKYSMSKDERQFFFDKINSLIDKKTHLKNKISFSVWYDNNYFESIEDQLDSPRSCFCGYFRATIDSDGSIFPCTHLSNPLVNRLFCDSFEIPNLIQNDIESAFYESALFRYFREAIALEPRDCK